MAGHKDDIIYAGVGAHQALSAGTLPSVLRALTDISSSTQFDVWSFLLHVRQYSTAKYVLDFLRRRYALDVAQARAAAEVLDAEGGPPVDRSRLLENLLQRHLLGSGLFKNAAKAIAEDSNASTHENNSASAMSEMFIEFKLGVLFLFETWLTSFPEDFIGAPEEYTPDGVETEVKDDWHHWALKNRSTDPVEGDITDQPRQLDALDLLIEFIENTLLPCPMMVILGAGHLWMPENPSVGQYFADDVLASSSPFASSFPCLYRLSRTVFMDLNDESSARMLSLEANLAETNVIKSNRNDGYDKSIIPLAFVICSINARSRLKRISQTEMGNIYEVLNGERTRFRSGDIEVDIIGASVKSGNGACECAAVAESCPPIKTRRRSAEHIEVPDVTPWYKSELAQLSELRMSITQILGTESMKCMKLVMEQYHPLVVLLRAAEMTAAENNDFELPVKVFVTPIDKQVLTYKYSKTKGFSTVAASMVALKHHFDDSNRESHTIGVNLVEAMRGYESGGSEDESVSSNDVPYKGILVPEESGISPQQVLLSEQHSATMTHRETTAIVVDEELGRELSEQAKEEEKTLVRPFLLWRRRKKRKELQMKLAKWKEKNNIPIGIDTCPGPVEVLKSRAVRGLTPSCKSSVLFAFAPSLLAYNLTLKLHYLYSSIPLLEFAVHAGFSPRSRREVPMLARFRRECDRMQELFVDEVLSESETMSRATLIINLIQIGEAAARMWSHHLMMLVVQALQCHAIHRLKETWKIVESAMPGAWTSLQDCAGFGGSTLLNSQMEKFLNFGFSDDYRKRINLQTPDRLRRCQDVSEDVELIIKGIEASISRASSIGLLLSPSDTHSVEQTDHESKDSAPCTGAATSVHNKKFGDSLMFMPGEKLYIRLGCIAPDIDCTDASVSVDCVDYEDLSASSDIHFVPEAILVTDAQNSQPIYNDTATSSAGLNNLVLSGEKEDAVLLDEAICSATRANVPGLKMQNCVECSDDDVGEVFVNEECSLHSHQESKCSTRQESMVSTVASDCFLKGHTGQKAVAAGIVRDDAAADLVGLPKPMPQAGMPYVNGIMSKLIRLSELPEYMRDAEDPDSTLFVTSPGLFEDDQLLPMINFGKLRSVARWMLLLRCTQLTPYRYDEKAVILDLHAMLLRPPAFKGQDAQWERSLHLEKKKS